MATNDHTDERPESVGDAAPVADEQAADINELVDEQAGRLPADSNQSDILGDKDKKVVQEVVDKALERANDKPVDKPAKDAPIIDDAGQDDIQKKILEGYKPSDAVDVSELENLKKQLYFYQQLHGADAVPPQQQQPVPVQQQSPQQDSNDWFNNLVNVSENELIDLASGDVQRALPVVRKFVATAAAVALQEYQNQNVISQRQQVYMGAVRKDFFERYEDLKEYPEIVRTVGDDIGSSYVKRGIRKMPHEVVDEIGTRCRELIAKFKGNGSVRPTTPTGSRQGAAGSSNLRPAPQQTEQLTEEKKEMYELFEQ